MKSKLWAAAIIPLALAGGMLFYSPLILACFTVLFWALLVANWFYVRQLPSANSPMAVILLAALISGLSNLDIAPVWLGRLLVGLLASLALLVSSAWLNNDDIISGLLYAGIIWPFIYLAAWLGGWNDHPNILAFYPTVFIITGLVVHKKWPIILNIPFLLYFGSRGAIIAVVVGLAVIFWPFIRRHWPTYGVLSAGGLAGLILLNPGTSMVRLYYWRAMLDAWLNSPWFGLGPGGIWARKIFPEDTGFIVHAHNTLVTCLTETGLIGLLAAALALAMLANMRYTRLQAALALALAAWSLVDEPLFWTGPLLVTVIIFSSLTWYNPPPKNVLR